MIAPYFSICMATYCRPVLLKAQLELILQQYFTDFEVIVSDNDSDCSARSVVESMGDARLRYFSNIDNIGMVKSYNKSIERASAKYVIMMTDDDPVDVNMLAYFNNVINNYPGYGVYAGCDRVGKRPYAFEIFDSHNFIFQLLNPTLTRSLMWSSCVLDKEAVLSIGGMPAFEHLSDHALVCLCSTVNGGVMINKMFSAWKAHDHNYSRKYIYLHARGVKKFYEIITGSVPEDVYVKNGRNALVMHCEKWFIDCMFSLRNHFTGIKNKASLRQLDHEVNKMLEYHFIRGVRFKYYLKLMIFKIKRAVI